MTMQASRIKESLRGGAVVGTWIQALDPTACEAAAAAGLDFVILDMEHGNFGDDSALHMIRACDAGGVDAIVRVPGAGIEKVKNALDWGAMGVLLPLVRTGREAAEFVRQARFEGPAGGARGGCPWIRCAKYTGVSYKDYVDWCDQNRQIWAVIETPQAVENIEDIARAGLDVLVLGPFDLANALGFQGDTGHPEVIRALDRVIEAARGQGVELCCTLFSADAAELGRQARAWKAKGVRFFTNPSPGALLFGAYSAFRRSCRGEITA